jgi:drug/metabolite transporter (DMT)-like permease
VVVSILFYHEQIIGRQQIGIALALAAVLLIARERAGNGESDRKSAQGFLFVAAAILAGAAAAISSRYAALGTDKIAFMAVSYGLSTLFVAGFGERGRRQEKAAAGSRESLRIGAIMGILNVVGYYAYLEGLTRGPLSLVTVITSMHFVVAVVLSILIYRERPTRLGITGIVLTIVSLVLLRG